MDTVSSPVPTVAALDALFMQSHEAPILLFLHADRCGVSRYASGEVSQVDTTIWLVDVQESQDLSREIECRTGIRHESPQVILLSHGRPHWSASHRHITTSAIQHALGSLPP
jgi:bacillithiol system protein YtxJ